MGFEGSNLGIHEAIDPSTVGTYSSNGCVGLAREAISIPARVTSIADVYDALRRKRSYKDAWPHDEAVDFIASRSGTQFDPVLTELFLSLAAAFA